MPMKAEIEIVFDRFPEIARNLQPSADRVVRKTAFDIQAGYQANCRRDTGAQAASAYVVTRNASTYATAVADAEAANPGVELLPEVPRPEPHSALVAIGVAYAAVNEFGGVASEEQNEGTGVGRAGDGALTQATNRARAPFFEAMQHLIDRS